MSSDIEPVAPEVEQEAGFDWQAFPRRVNLGCGWDRRDGYLNVDMHAFHQPDLLADVRDCHLLPTGQYDEVLARDVLEHLPRSDAPVALAEWARLLRVGGTLVLRVPDLIGLLHQFELEPDPARHALLVQCLYGTQAYDGDWHANGFTELLLRQALFDAGFDVVTIAHFDEWLFDVVAVRTEVPRPVSEAGLVFTSASNADLPPAPDAQPASSIDEALARLAAARVSATPQPTSSRVPGGALLHRVANRVMARHLAAIAAQTNAALDAVSDAIRTLVGDPGRHR